CVYPLIPITVCLFGARNEASRLRAFLLGVSYVLGMAVTYTTMGMVSALGGVLFGSLISHPIVVLFSVALLLLLALATLDAIPFSFGSKLCSQASKVSHHGLGGAFLMGLVSGIIAAPCVGPIVVVILGLAAASQSPLWGGCLLFVYSLGLGTLFLLLAVFSQLACKLPRPGKWLVGVKFLLALCIILVAIHLLFPLTGILFPGLMQGDRVDLLLLVGLISLGFAVLAYSLDNAGLKTISAILLAICIYHGAIAHPKPGMSQSILENEVESDLKLKWHSSLQRAIGLAETKNSLIMIDSFADWCAACKELDAHTFSDRNVQAELRKLVLVKIDFTNETEQNKAIQAAFSIVGLPAVIFLDSSGTEIPGTRISGFIPPDEFISHLKSVAELEKAQQAMAKLKRDS
ncbi:MAG: thioredoxin family protein, partial [Bdellovibrionales bacterium]|nr:thioredoxin family protein [Bdellovibrionales bacterium]